MQEQNKELSSIKALAQLLRNPQGVVSRGIMHDAMKDAADLIEQQAEELAILRDQSAMLYGALGTASRAADRAPAQPSPAVDLSGLTRAYNSGYKAGHHDTVEAQYTDIAQCDMYTYHSDVVAELVADGTLSAPVVREGKMTDERIAEILRTQFADFSCTPDDIAFARAIEREVLATGKGLDSAEWHKAALEVLTVGDTTTPSTPSQAWEGELPELPDFKMACEQGALFFAKDMEAYARKAIGAAIAGVADLAVQWGNTRLDDHGGNALRNFAEYIRSLSSNPVSLTEKDGWISVEERLPEPNKAVALLNAARLVHTSGEFDINWHSAGWLCEFGGKFWSLIGEARAMTLDSVTHWMPLPQPPASNGNGEKGGAA